MRRLSSLLPALLPLCLSSVAGAATVASFEVPDDLKLFTPGGTQIERVQEHATDGAWSLKVFFPGSDKDTWPGVFFRPPVDPSRQSVLSFDVYNPESTAVTLSMRIDPVQGSPEFSGNSIPPRATKRVEFSIAGMGAIKQFFPYLRIPRQSCTLYFDNFRLDTYSERYTAIRYVDNNPLPAPTDAERQHGMILFQRPFTDPVFANTRPLAHERISAVNLFATPGEYEPATLSIYALQDLRDISVRVEGLPASVEVLPIRFMDKRVTYSDKRYIAGMPVLCERKPTVSVAANACQSWMIDVHVNADAPAGIHVGTLTLQRAGGPAVTLPVRLRVLPFKLSEPTHMIWGEYYVRPRFAKSDAEVIALLEPHMRDMRAHSMTSVGLCIGPPAERATYVDDDNCQLNLDGSSIYEHFFDIYKQLGFPAPVVLLSDGGQTAASLGGVARMSPQWDRRYQAYWRAMQAEHKRRGWAEVIVQPVDEPAWQGPEERERNLHCLKLLKQIPDLRTEQDGPGDNYFHAVAGPFADVWNYNGTIGTPAVVAKAQAEGKIVMLYNCDVESYRPETDRYTAGWFQVRAGTSGCYNWAYISYGGSPYNDQDGPSGDWMHVYPPLSDEPGGPSTGWIGAREGVDDYKCVYTLRQVVARAQASDKPAAQAAAAAGRAELDAILASIDYSPAVRGQARWTVSGADANGPTISGTLKQPNGWQHEDYERARWRVASATWQVLAALGEAPAAPAPPTPGERTGALLTALAWQTGPGPEAARPTTSDRQVTIPVWTDSPTIDGDLSDPIWKQAAKLEPFTLVTGKGMPQQQTDVLVGADARNLYVAAVCHEDNISHLTARVTQDGGRVWEDDCVELFVDGSLSRSHFRQVVANSLGVQSWNDPDDRNWRAASKVKTKVLDDRWQVEWAIPLSDLGVTGAPFGFNICRERRPMESLELSCWSPTGSGFGVPAMFGVASLGQAWIGAVRIPPAVIGANAFTVTLKNETAQPRTVRLQTRTLTAGATEPSAPVDQQACTLGPGASATANLRYDVDPMAITAPRVILQVLDAATGQLLAERNFTPTFLTPLKLSLQPRMSYLSQGAGTLTVEVNVANSILGAARLTFELINDADGRTVDRAEPQEIRGNQATGSVNLGGLPAGRYSLCARVLVDGKPVAEAKATLQKVVGPFD